MLQKSKLYHQWHRHPYHKKIHAAGLAAAIIAIIAGSVSILFPAGFARATEYNFSQTSWSGNADVAALANHTSNQSNWTKYYSSSNVTAGDSVTLTNSVSSVVEGDETDFDAGSVSTTVVSGSGDSAIVQLSALTGANAWTAQTTTNGPADSAGVGTLVSIGNVVYTHQNNNTSNIYAYNTGTSTWSTLTTTPIASNEGSLSSDGTDLYWYNLANNTFYKYDLSESSWGALTACSSCNNSNYAQNLQSIYYSGKIYLYEGTATSFRVYTIATDSWADVALPSNAAGVGFNIAPYNGKIYATKMGVDNTTFGYYDLTAETWTTDLTVIPATNDRMGAFLINVGDYFYFNKGKDTSTFWQYDIVGNSWAAKTDLTALARAWSGNFTYTGGNIYWMTGVSDSPVLYAYKVEGYESSGTFISQSLDLASGVNVGNLDFTVSAPASTEIKFQVAANTDNATWNYVGSDGTAGTYFTATGTAINSSLSGNRYFRYKAYLSTTSPTVTPTLTDITINYNKYTASGTLISSPYDSSDPGNILNQLSWTEDLPSGTDVKYQISTAPDDNDAPGLWSDFVGPTGVGDYYTSSAGSETINSTQTDGTNDQWVKYEVFLSTTDTSVTPTLSDLSLQYILNTTPTITITNSPAESSAGVYTINYNLSDPEETSLSVYVTASFGATLSAEINSSDASATLTSDVASAYTFLPTGGGTILIGNEMITYTSRSGTTLSGLSRAQLNTVAATHASSSAIYLRVTAGLTGDVGTVLDGDGKSITMTLATAISGLEVADATIKLVVNDGNIANQFNSAETSTLIMDSKAPTAGSVILNSRTDALTLAATDSNSISMKISNDADLSADGTNADSGSWIAFSTSKAWTPNTAGDRTETVYSAYKDAYGNTTSTISTTTAVNPINVLIQDTSNPSTPDWRLFISWDAVANPSEGFAYYQIYRSTDNNTYATRDQVSSRLTNYYVDTSLDNATVYYYKITVVDNHGNESNYSTPSSASAAAAQSGTGLMPNGSGGGDYTAPVISSISAGTPTTTAVTITWTTDESSNSTVGYSTNTGYASENGIPTMTTSHSVTLSNLTVNTEYYFRVISYDATGNKATGENSETQNFTTSADTTGPTISNINVVSGTTSAGVAWSTNEASNSVVHYGLTDSVGSTSTSGTLVSGHALTLTGLTSNTTYYYNVASTDAYSNTTTSSTTTFVTTATGYEDADVTAPTISAVAAGSVTTSGATITWTTNENSNSTVGYSTDTNYASESGVPTNVTSHSVTLSHLSPSTTYYFQVISYDSSGNRGISTNSETQNFTTSADTTAPTISNINVVSGTTSAGVAWSTNEASDSVVEYGLTNSLGGTTSVGTSVSGHAVTLSGLTSNTTYYYRVKSTDAYTNLSTSSIDTFATTATGYEDADVTAPAISALAVGSLTTSGATITWTTNEAATSTIGFSTDTNYATETGASGLATSHSVSLSNLSANTKYYFRVISYDSAGNKGLSESSSTQYFTTSADTTAPTITGIAVTTGTTSAGVVWSTNEASDSVVEYGLSEDLGTTGTSTSLVSGHAISLTGLTSNTLYYYRVSSTDGVDNVTTSSIDTFTTTATGYENADLTAPIISAVTVSSITSTTAVVTYTLNENSLGRIIYGTATSYGSGANEGNNEYESTKTTTLAGLSTGTIYHYKVSASDADGNLNSTGDLTFTTLTPTVVATASTETSFSEAQSIVDALSDPSLVSSDNGPKISSSGPTITAINENDVTISWTTDKRSTSAVLYRVIGNGTDFITAGDTNYARSHLVTIENLEPNQNYEYKIQSADVAGNMTTSNLYSVTTLSGSISSVLVSNVTESKSTISWTTPALTTGAVEYNGNLADKSLTSSDNNLGRNHSVSLSNLSEDTRYNFTVVMRTEKGDTVRSGSYNFTTLQDKTSPAISKVENRSALVSGSQDKVQTVITWETNKPTDSQVVYAENNLNSKSVITTPLSTDFVLDHTVVLVDLKSSTVYQYYLISKDKAGNSVKSDKYMLLTPARNASIFDLILGGLKQAFGWTKNL